MTTSTTVPAVDRSPPYQQIAAYYRDQMRTGQIAVGDLLPANRKMSEQWGKVSTHTVQRAIQVLREEGLIETRPAKPPRVIALPAPEPPT